MTFNIQPSVEFIRLTAERDELKQQFFQPNLSIEQCHVISDQLACVHAALDATPEQQFLNDVRDAEQRAYEQNMAAELARRGRMTTGLHLAPEGRSIDDAIMDRAFASVAVEVRTGEPLVVVADMRMMSAAQVAKCLREMANHIEEDGIAVYHGPWPDGSDDEWWVDEGVDGMLSHLRFRSDRYSRP
jgi:hypothetical protein